MSPTTIEWTEETWNPVSGCSKVSPGCDHCYAEAITNRFGGPGAFDKIVLHPERLEKPLHWRKPRRVFVNSMSDLFHADVPHEFIAKVFAVMALKPAHTFQILTKRPGRMQSLLSSKTFADNVRRLISMGYVREGDGNDRRGPWRHKKAGRGIAPLDIDAWMLGRWPLPNVWLGVSVENQEQADKRIPVLLDTPAAVRFISAEPLLGPVDVHPYLRPHLLGVPISRELRDDGGLVMGGVLVRPDHPGLDWVIAGGESGQKARPMDVAWARSLRDQCRASGVLFFMKQMGSNPCDNGTTGPGQHWPDSRARRHEFVLDGVGVRFHIALNDRKGGDPAEWPEDLRARELPQGAEA